MESLESLNRAVESPAERRQGAGFARRQPGLSGRLQEALLDVDEALKIAPESPHANYNRAAVLADLRRSEEAASAYDRVLALVPEHEADRRRAS